MLPSKVTPLSQSVLCKLPYILDTLKSSPLSIFDLWNNLKSKFNDISEFMYAIDILYMLDTISITEKGDLELNA